MITPNPDMFPGIDDKYYDVLGLPADTTDLVLYGLEHALPVDEIAAQLHLDSAKVRELKELVGFSEHMRNPSMSLMD